MDFAYRIGETEGSWTQQVSQTEGLKVLWWNLGCVSKRKLEKFNDDQRHNESQQNLLKNLEALLENSTLKPDVLIFGEYCPRSVGEDTEGTGDFLKKHYRHRYQVTQYTPFHGQSGMRVFSRFKLKNVTEDHLPPGDWLEHPEMKVCAQGKETHNSFQKDRYSFPYVDFEIQTENKDYRLVATHFPNPWNLWLQCRGKLSVASEILWGTENPNHRHAEALTSEYSSADRTLIIGDFNAPKEIQQDLFLVNLKVVSQSYKLLSRVFGESVVKSKKPTGINQKSSRAPMSIDHAFASDDLQTNFADVIPLAGSDHLPLYVIIH